MRDKEVHKPIGYSMRHVRLEHRVKTHSGHYVDPYDMHCLDCGVYALSVGYLDTDNQRVITPPSTCPYGES